MHRTFAKAGLERERLVARVRLCEPFRRTIALGLYATCTPHKLVREARRFEVTHSRQLPLERLVETRLKQPPLKQNRPRQRGLSEADTRSRGCEAGLLERASNTER